MVLELIGRMWLWKSALVDCEDCLTLANRLMVTATSEAVQSEQNALDKHYETVTGRKVDPHVAYSNDQSVFATFERSILTPTDCHKAAYQLQNLAVIYFMQIYADGDSDTGKVATNKGAAEIERNRLEELAFTSRNDLRNYRKLIEQLRKIRNKRLGHAAGSEFNVSHQPNSVSSTVTTVPIPLLIELNAAIQRLTPVISNNIHDLLRTSSPAN